MKHSQVIDGTSEEITTLLQGRTYAGRKMRITIELDEDEVDFTDTLPDPPNTIQDSGHLERLLLEGLQSGPATPMNETDWDDIRCALDGK